MNGQPVSVPRPTGMPFARHFSEQSIMPSKTTLPLNCESSVAWLTERSNSAKGSAGESVVMSAACFSLNSEIISSSAFAPCSIVSTPFSSATRTPSGLSTWAATMSPRLCASSHAALTTSGGIFSAPGSPLTFASSTPPVIISFMRSGLSSAIFATKSLACSGLSAIYASEPAMCPSGTETAIFAARILGPTVLPAFISSRMLESAFSTPPTVLMVVTPLLSCI